MERNSIWHRLFYFEHKNFPSLRMKRTAQPLNDLFLSRILLLHNKQTAIGRQRARHPLPQATLLQ